MLVYCNFSFPSEIGTKQIKLFEFVDGVIYHFQNLNFGEGVEEITYYVVGGDMDYLSKYGAGISYYKKRKAIGSLFVIDYATVQLLEGEALFNFISQQVINETRRFSDKMIKKFDLEGYIGSLDKYFSEAIQLMTEGKRPAEGKMLNEDIQMAIARKFSKL